MTWPAPAWRATTTPGALPTVAPAGIEEDLGRRDFTVNALALGVAGSSRGRLVEAPHGREDIEARRLRVLHDGSFIDDPTRLLRLARYAGRLGFAVESATLALAQAAVAARATDTVTGPRLGTELRLLAEQGDPLPGFRVLADLGIDEAIAPGLGIRDEERAELARRGVSLLPPDGAPADLVLAVASLDVPGTRLRDVLDQLAFPAARRDRIVAAATRAPALAQGLERRAGAIADRRARRLGPAGARRPRRERWVPSLRRGGGWTSCATCAWRSTATIFWRREWSPGPPWGPAWPQRAPPSSTGAPRGARPSSPRLSRAPGTLRTPGAPGALRRRRVPGAPGRLGPWSYASRSTRWGPTSRSTCPGPERCSPLAVAAIRAARTRA